MGIGLVVGLVLGCLDKKRGGWKGAPWFLWISSTLFGLFLGLVAYLTVDDGSLLSWICGCGVIIGFLWLWFGADSYNSNRPQPPAESLWPN